MPQEQYDNPRPTDELAVAAPLAGARSQSIQRLQVGVFGLAAMVVLVGLANIILTNAKENEARVVPEAAPTMEALAETPKVSDPLADAGVVPDIPSSPRPAPPASPPERFDRQEP